MDEMCKVVIVDDEFIMRQGLKYMIDWEKEQFEIVGEASNGNEALLLLEHVKPHIILCDVVMPQMDGLEFSKIVHNIYPEIRLIMLSGYDDFEYVKGTLLNGAIDYILKPTLNPEELLVILQKAANKIPGLSIQKKEERSIEKRIEHFFLDTDVNYNFDHSVFPNTFFRMMAIYLKYEDKKDWNMQSVFLGKIKQYLEKKSIGKQYTLFFKDKLLIVIFNYNMKEREEIKNICEEIVKQLTYLNPALYTVCSEESISLEELKQCYHSQILAESEKAFYYKGCNLRFLEKNKHLDQPIEPFNYTLFSSYINSRHYAEGVYMLNDYINHAMDLQMKDSKLKNILKNMLYNLLDSINGNQDELDEMRYRYFDLIDQSRYADELLDAFGFIREDVMTYVQAKSYSEDTRINKMLDYISNHYAESLDLASLAKVFNFNYYYLSAYFSQHMVEGFSGYLNRLRIDQACRLLEKEDYTIAQISSMVGYSEQSYFSRVFKKMTGMTPSKWRAKYHRGVYEEKRKKI